MIERTAYAKINLSLHVTGQRDDGYHLLDSIVVFAETGDEIRVIEPHHPHGPIEVVVDGPFSQGLSRGIDNIMTMAALMLQEAVRQSGKDPAPVLLHLKKNLPVASGIGGGSADAAATLLALKEYWETDVDVLPIAAALGADVAMCLHSTPLRARGTGDHISLLETGEALSIVLVNPGVGVSTPEVFKALENKTNSPVTAEEISSMPDLQQLISMRNDLQQPAETLQPIIRKTVSELAATDPLLTRMSGSGATCFGIYASMKQAEAAADKIRDENPGWWCVATRTTVS